jgi:plasmid replication initiation protein
MTSIYAIRLYELLAQWQSVGKREIELDWLKEQFEITDQYTNMCDFKKRVLDPAVKDINEHSNFQVSWTQRKTGRQVTHLTFKFSEKQPLTPKKPKKPATTSTTKPAEVKVNNIDHFADLRKRLGDIANEGIPEDIVNILKAQGCW